MGKYDAVIKGLPREVQGDATYREKVDAAKAELEVEGCGPLAEMYAELRAHKGELETQMKALNVKIAAVEEALWSAYEDAGVTSVTTARGAVRLQPEPVARVTDRDQLREWAVNQGLERLLTLPWQTVNAQAKERLLSGDAMPAGVEINVRTRTVFTKKS